MKFFLSRHCPELVRVLQSCDLDALDVLAPGWLLPIFALHLPLGVVVRVHVCVQSCVQL